MPRFDAVGVGGDRADVPVNVGRTLGPDWMETNFLRSPNLYGVSLLDVGPERVLTYLVLKRVERLGFEEAASRDANNQGNWQVRQLEPRFWQVSKASGCCNQARERLLPCLVPLAHLVKRSHDLKSR
jgi:hypothetical protein